MDWSKALLAGLLLSAALLLVAAWAWVRVASQGSSLGPPLSVSNVKRAASLSAAAMAALALTILVAARLL
jgi:hypothetical protein